jgi:hypothetical protein
MVNLNMFSFNVGGIRDSEAFRHVISWTAHMHFGGHDDVRMQRLSMAAAVTKYPTVTTVILHLKV